MAAWVLSPSTVIITLPLVDAFLATRVRQTPVKWTVSELPGVFVYLVALPQLADHSNRIHRDVGCRG